VQNAYSRMQGGPTHREKDPPGIPEERRRVVEKRGKESAGALVSSNMDLRGHVSRNPKQNESRVQSQTEK